MVFFLTELQQKRERKKRELIRGVCESAGGGLALSLAILLDFPSFGFAHFLSKTPEKQKRETYFESVNIISGLRRSSMRLHMCEYK